jgi:hypothetical protein
MSCTYRPISSSGVENKVHEIADKRPSNVDWTDINYPIRRGLGGGLVYVLSG